MRWIQALAALLPLLTFSLGLWAQPMGFSGTSRSPAGTGMRSQVPVVVNPPFMYDPDHDLYDWKIDDDDENKNTTSCYYDSYYGQWFGNCLLYQTAPGYSITVPNQIRR